MFRKIRMWIMLCVLTLVPIVSLFAAESGSISNDLSSVKAGLLAALYASLLAIIPLIGKLIHKLLNRLINQIDNETLRGLAIQAVLFAEDKFGADTATGSQKLTEAINWIVQKTGVDRAAAEASVRAAYQNIFTPFESKQTS